MIVPRIFESYCIELLDEKATILTIRHLATWRSIGKLWINFWTVSEYALYAD